jgi:transketolase
LVLFLLANPLIIKIDKKVGKFMVNNNLNLNAIRMLGVQAINKANSGHPGIVLDAAPIVYTLYADVMNIDPKDSK